MWQGLKDTVIKFINAGLASKVVAALGLGGFWGFILKIGVNLALGWAIKLIEWAARKGEAAEVERKTEEVLKKVKEAKDEEEALREIDNLP